MRHAAYRLVAAIGIGLAAAGAGARQTAEVTRFHLGEPIARSTVKLEAADPRDTGSLEFASYADAVAHELTAQSFVVANDPASAYVGVINVTVAARAGRPRGSFSIGIGGGSFGRGGGVGGGVAVPVAGGRPTDIRATTLGLQLKRRSDGSIVWEGRATTEAQGPAGDPSRAVPLLARVLLTDFPGPRGQTIRVKVKTR